jgi:hypothetical protein
MPAHVHTSRERDMKGLLCCSAAGGLMLVVAVVVVGGACWERD